MGNPSAISVFRQRLKDVIAQSGRSQAGFAAACGFDRSTLTLLLDDANDRLPRAQTLLQIAAQSGVSIDWLLGLSEAPDIRPDVVASHLVSHNADDPADSHLRRWHREAEGQKVRYVPATIPDAFKTDAVIAHEFKLLDGGRQEAETIMRERIAQAKAGASAIETCTPRQALEGLARGEGIWRQLSLRERRRQLDHIAMLAADLSPAYRWFMFDGRMVQATPYTVFGQRRAAVYMGGLYLVFTGSPIIRALSQHFDGLVRRATLQPAEIPPLARQLLKEI